MAHGAPDWGVTAGAVTTYRLLDLAELAVRLGSIVAFDRLGEVVFLDDFELVRPRYSTSSSGTGAATAYDGTVAHSGVKSYKLTGGSEVGAYAQRGIVVCAMLPSRVGHQISFAHAGPLETFRAIIDHFDGTTRYRAVAAWNAVTEEITIDNDSGVPVAVASGVELLNADTAWHTLKLVIDANTNKYVRVKLDAYAIDIQNFEMAATGAGDTPRLEYTNRVESVAGGNGIAWIDDFVITQNEPEGSPLTEPM